MEQKKGKEVKQEPEIEISNRGQVIIGPNAFRKLLFHTLQYIDDELDNKVEVLGICIGDVNQETEIIEIFDVIPLFHGEFIELGLSETMHDAFEKIRTEYVNENGNVVGWYLSHPGYGLFLSESDKKIHAYFQNQENPLAIAIIIDPKQIKDDDFGYDIFRFKQINNHKDYVKVRHELSPPKTMAYFKWIQDLVESAQKSTPLIISEYNESIKPKETELQKIPEAESSQIGMDPDNITQKMTSIVANLKDSSTTFTGSLLNPFISEFQMWLLDFQNGSLRGIEYIKSSLNQLKNTIDKGLSGLQGYYKHKFKEISDVFVNDISNSLTVRINSEKELKELINVKSKAILEEIEKSFNIEIDSIKIKCEKSLEEFKDTNEKAKQAIMRVKELIDNNSSKQEAIYKEIDNLSENIIGDIKNLNVPFEATINKEIDNVNISSIPIEEKYKEIEEIIERLQKMISELRQLK